MHPGLKMKSDIQNKSDLKILIDTFYSSVLENAMLKPFFQHIDFEHHKPNMIAFWAFICFDQTGYTTNVTKVHENMPLNGELFTEWVSLFHQTVDLLFEGEKARLVKERATIMGLTMASKHSN